MKFTFATLLLCIAISSFSQTTSQYIDTRDGQVYPTIILDYKTEQGVPIKKEWFAQNLSLKTDQSFCYKSEAAYCDSFGRLYLWEAAKSACPAGWHLPTNEEWNSLIMAFGGLKEAGAYLNEYGDTGLDLQMGGFGDVSGQYIGIGASGYYWSIKGSGSELITIDASTDEILYDPIGNANKNSVRCVRN